MSKDLTETIRVLPLVRKFLALHYDTAPFRLVSNKNPFATFLVNSLDAYPSKEVFRDYDKLTDTLSVYIPYGMVRYQSAGRCFNQKKVIGFNEFVRQSFLQMAVQEIGVRVESGERVVKAAEMILKRYRMEEDDLSIDALTRYYRAYAGSRNGQVKATW